MKKLSLFTPCYNEEENVYSLYKKVTEVMQELPQYEYEYVFIDNNSSDNTQAVLRKIADEDKRVKVIFNVKNFGPSRSGSYGFFQTTGDASICLACDFQDPPELIPEFIKKWENGFKVVWGRKSGSAENKIMYLIRCLYYKIIKNLAEEEQYENVTGFGLYDKEVMEHMRNAKDPTPNFRNLVSDLGYEVGFVEYIQPKRERGKSSYNFLRYLNIAINSLINTSRMPLRLATLFGAIVSGICFLIGIVYLILKIIFWNSFYIGMAPLLIGIFFIGGIQILFIGIVGEYVGEILARVMNRPMVIEKERINFEEKTDGIVDCEE